MRCLSATTSAVRLVSIGFASSFSCPLVWSYMSNPGGRKCARCCGADGHGAVGIVFVHDDHWSKHRVANGQLLAARVGSYSEPDPLVAESFQHQLQGVQCTCEECHVVPKHGSSPKVGHQMAHPCDHGKPRLLDDLPSREGPTCCNERWADDMGSRRVALPPMPLSCRLGFMATAFERVCQRARGCLLLQLRE